MEEAKRGPGRPKQSTIKKGKPSWKPASLNIFDNLEPGYRYRMMRKDPENLAKKSKEGWEIVNGTQSPSTQYENPEKIGDHTGLTSVLEGKDWVLGRIDEETAEARDEYMNLKTERKTRGLTAHIQKDLAQLGAKAHGDITISSRKGQQ